jgi:hypothetical protein
MPPNIHKRKETSWQIGRIFEAHLSLRAITPRLLRYTWGFDEGRISDANLYNIAIVYLNYSQGLYTYENTSTHLL